MQRFSLAALLVLALGAGARAQNFADCLPEKTVFYVSLDNVARMRDRIEKSGFKAMWNDPAMELMRKAFEQQIEESADDTLDPSELFGLVQGQMALAMIPRDQTAYATLGMMDMTGKRDEIMAFLQKAREDVAEGIEVRETEDEFNGYTITTRESLAEGAEEPVADYYAIKENVFFICDDLDVLKDALVRRDAEEKSGLAQTAAFQKVTASVRQRPDVRWFVPASLWLRELGMAAGFLPLAGLENVRGVGGQLTIDDRGVSMQILVHNTGEARGLLKLLGTNVPNLGPPALFPADSDPTVALALDWGYLYEEVFRVLKFTQPELEQQLLAGIGQMEQQLGFKLKEDLFDSLAPGFSYGMLPIPQEGEGGELTFEQLQDEAFMSQFVVMAQKLKNKETIARLMSKMVAQEGSGMKESEYLGTTIWESTGEGEPVFTITGDHLVMALKLESVQAMIRRQGKEMKGVSDSEAFRKMVDLIPAKRSMLAMVNPAAGETGLIYEGFKAGFAASAPEGMSEQLPTREFFKKYLGLFVYSLSMEEQGLMFTLFWNVKPKEAEAE
ncbi:MAG: DUF3352 domain-containing protein [Planctomycetota bacterium]